MAKRKALIPGESTNEQFDLFRQFLSNDSSEVSNTIELWESIPKYFFTPRQVKKLRTADGLAKPYRWEYTHDGYSCVVRIQPALIEQSDGSYLACFPGVTEELIEEALKKILTEQQQGAHDGQRLETWVHFSLRMIQRELKQRGRDRNVAEIKRGIEIMSKCNIEYTVDGKASWNGPILSDLWTVDRSEYIADRESRHAARLPLFVTHGIEKLQYRQFNFVRLMACDEQLARWIYKRLINRYRQASKLNDYHFAYSSIKLPSGLLQQAREVDNRTKVVSALDELKRRDVIAQYQSVEQKQGRKIVDVVYNITPTLTFIKEQKAANKRFSDAEGRIGPVDK